MKLAELWWSIASDRMRRRHPASLNQHGPAPQAESSYLRAETSNSPLNQHWGEGASPGPDPSGTFAGTNCQGEGGAFLGARPAEALLLAIQRPVVDHLYQSARPRVHVSARGTKMKHIVATIVLAALIAGGLVVASC
jgi:hypothetical protein